MSERSTSAVWVRGIVEALSATGLDMQRLCAEAAIDDPARADPSAVYSTEAITRLWQLAVAQSGDPAIALRAAQGVRPAIFGLVGYVMMSSANLATALERLIRYLRIISHAAAVRAVPQGEDTAFTLELHGGAAPLPRQRFEFDLLTLLTFCRWVLGRELRPLAVSLTHEAPPDPHAYLQAFRCMPQFGARSNGAVLARCDLEAPLPTFHPQMAELHDRFAGDRIEALERPPATYTQRVRQMVAERLPEGEPGRTAIARALGVAERTLQRRLQHEGTSFHALIDDTRRAEAERHLAQPQLTLAEVAYLLGFASQGNLTRACRRWFGMTPGQYRARAVTEPVPPQPM
ncbi:MULTISPECIES: AraC family transcriptional regulator [unclassified Variovorax]|uniref:AraC family transcriptional regulator n=1 Tax=unclassified Variovorax TaxID=663243 RepID=UPI002574A889|nr:MULTISPECIES: AraC family transcriptional regulator [unclassified Variovorax]MDM0088601.1 AraC family transcriptional regulator [Variovorax sp. J22G40]MDM0146674.1 AraC family transcriptional regulator [Variovorax sp. J2P1-31]